MLPTMSQALKYMFFKNLVASQRTNLQTGLQVVTTDIQDKDIKVAEEYMATQP